jgi:hypothetical protein
MPPATESGVQGRVSLRSLHVLNYGRPASTESAIGRGGVQWRRRRRFLPLSIEKIMTKVKNLARIRAMFRPSSSGGLLRVVGSRTAT